MIVAERKAKVVISKMDRFGESVPAARLTAPSEAILQSKKLGKPLTESEMGLQGVLP